MVIVENEYVVTVPPDLGAALKRFRTAGGVTQRDAAEMEGVGQSYLSALEGGKFGSSLRHALRLLRLLGCEVVVRPREPNVSEQLVVWLYGTPVATLSRADRYRISLDWLSDGETRWGAGSRILSVSLPLGSRFGARDNRPLDFFENLLPEGATRDAMARIAGVSTLDTFGVLAEFGQDCAGAVMVLPEGETPPAVEDIAYSLLSEADLSDAIRKLAELPLGADPARGFKPSLAGFQRKLLVGRDASGGWQRPLRGAPSTWILKPDGRTAMATNEINCIDLARSAGLRTPSAELISIDGIPTAAIARYDRTASLDRIHQEDGCQATGSPAGWKYEIQGGPSLKALATVLRDHATADALVELLARVTFNVVTGNADAHAKNFSLLHPRDGSSLELAPVYDVIATVELRPTDDHGRPIPNDTRMGQMIDGVLDVDRVTRTNLVAEGLSWDLRSTVASTAVDDTLDAVSSAAVQGDNEWLADLVARRTAAIAGR